MEKRIIWIQNHPEVCNAYNSKEEHLGSLQYERVGKFMHWCWYQMDDIRMSPECLQEVRDKQKELCNFKNSANAKTNSD